jgi:methionyl-tRNA formyltransferase
MKPIPLLFMGSPQVAVAILEELIQAGHEIRAVITQPDKPAGRGQHLAPPPVKVFAESHHLTVFQPTTLKDPKLIDALKSLKPQAIVIVAYGKLIPPEIISLPPWGCINVHFSLLPKYRGASCIATAIRNEEKETGVTIMRINEKLDAGPILKQQKVMIDPEETTESLEKRLTQVGGKLLLETLAELERNSLIPYEQDETQTTYAPLLKKEDGRIDWNASAEQIHNLIRAMIPWPVAYTFVDKNRIKVYGAKIAKEVRSEKLEEKNPGQIIGLSDAGIEVVCGSGRILLTEIQPESKRRMNAKDFIQGHRNLLKVGTILI